MPRVNSYAVSLARATVRKVYGSLYDLPEEIRNTIANTYYEYYCMQEEGGIKGLWDRLAGRGEFMSGIKLAVEDKAHLAAAVNNMPEVMNRIRAIAKDGRNCDMVYEVFLMIFKYRMPDADKKSLEQMRLERPSYAARVREIPELWKKM